MNTGSVVTNFHEGSRSEYLAEYVFAGLGTAVAIPHQEDAGIDLYCTLTERIGKLAWPRMHYTVQVKSAERPWEFAGEQSVRWLLEHPLPLFLCAVDKAEARLRVYKTHVRFAADFFARRPAVVRLHPGTPSDDQDLQQNARVLNLAMREPILDRTIVDLLDDAIADTWRSTLWAWTGIEQESIARWRRGVRSVPEPAYRTNEPPDWQAFGTTSAMLGPAAIPELVNFLEEVSEGYRLEDDRHPEALLTETLLCLLHRQLSRGWSLGERLMGTHQRLNALLEEAEIFGGAERLIETIRRCLTA